MNARRMRKGESALLLLLALALLTGCGPGQAVEAQDVARSDVERISAPDVPGDDLQAVVSGNSEFALDLYQVLRERNGNLFLSPHSISTALAMTYAGARGETATQMADTLHFNLPQERLHAAFNALDLALEPNDEPSGEVHPFTLNIANSLWGERSYTFLPEFLDLLARNYGAGMRLTDFAGQPEASRRKINDWVAEQTEDKIQNLIRAGLITPDTRLVLVNAIYFNAPWLYPFEEELTEDASFMLLDGSEVTVPMMRWAEPENVGYLRGEGFQAVELPYQAGDARMLILVPDEGSFASFEAGLTAEQIKAIVDNLSYESVRLSLPKFSFESQFELKEILAAMGMPAAMDPSQADFSGMDGTRNLSISEVVHKAFVDVDEEGTEAAAATAVIMVEAAMPLDQAIEVTVDRPFITLIRDTETGALLFVGRVMNPAQ